ncbi:MAG: TetR/AcrR family transcriptional regulator [Solirubrobacteraceae bacterium]|nr:TetR/AcrR family transcriptional regulator [Solirubrobacteraceae bacterium]
MTVVEADSGGRLRADAERNRARVLDAAQVVFGRDGPSVGVDAIACEAGVGVGTVYRRFPTKQDLLRAVIERLGDQIVEEVAATATDAPPGERFDAVFSTLAVRYAGSRALVDAVNADEAGAEEIPVFRARVERALRPVVEAAQGAGAVRRDVRATDVIGLAGATSLLAPPHVTGDAGLWLRARSVVLDGLRPDAATPFPDDAGPAGPDAAR